MLKARIIPCLDVKDGRVVKGVNFVDLREQSDRFEHVAAFIGGTQPVSGGRTPVRARAYLTSESFFDALGVRPLHGTARASDPAATA